MQSVIRARRWPVRSSSCSAVARSIAPVAPRGWPSAMAPPLTFTFSSGMPSSWATTSGTGAKASLISKRSMPLTLRSACASALRVDGMGPVSISTGSDPATAIETIRARGLSPRLRARPLEAITTAAAPSTIPELLPACSTPSSLNGELVQLLARVAPLRRAQLGGQPLRDQPGPVLLEPWRNRSLAAHRVGAHRHAGHVLHSAGDHQLRGAGEHRLRPEVHRLQAGAAEAVHGRPRHLDRQPRGEHRAARDVEPLLADLRDAAHDHVVDVLRLEPRVGQRRRERLRQQIDGVELRQRSLPLPARGSHRIDDDRFCHHVLLPAGSQVRSAGRNASIRSAAGKAYRRPVAGCYPCRKGFFRTMVCTRSAPTDTAIASTLTRSSTRSTYLRAFSGRSLYSRTSAMGSFHPGSSSYTGCACSSSSGSEGNSWTTLPSSSRYRTAIWSFSKPVSTSSLVKASPESPLTRAA